MREHANGVEPLSRFRIVEVMVRDPPHEPLPVSCPRLNLQESRATLSKLVSNIFWQLGFAFPDRSCPIPQSLPIDVTRNSVGQPVWGNPFGGLHDAPYLGHQMRRLIARCGHVFPFFE